MVQKKILIMTYYWPPSGGSGVQRWLKFVKYLPEFGWTPYVVTPENPSFTIRDESLLQDVPVGVEVVKLPIWEPHALFHRISGWLGRKGVAQSDFVATGNRSFFQKLTLWIRGNFFIPDARVFWVKPAASFLESYIKKNEIRTIISTGPPHSIHLIGLRLKRKDPSLQWLADFRDPWSAWDLLDTLSLTARSRRAHRELERQVLVSADQVTTISPYHSRLFQKLSGRNVQVITNGFDAGDFIDIQKVRNQRFTIRHLGIVDELRDPRPVMEAIRELCTENSDFATHVAVEFIGHVNSAFKEMVRSTPALQAFTSFVDHLPHRQLLQLYGATDLQLLVLAHTVIAPGNLPGKFFEYLASGNPILAIGPVTGDAGEILRQTRTGEIVERSDTGGIKASLLRSYEEWKKGPVQTQQDITSYTRRQLTAQLVKLLESTG